MSTLNTRGIRQPFVARRRSIQAILEAFETKSWLVECRVASDLTLTHVPPGTYTAIGWFVWKPATPETVIVEP